MQAVQGQISSQYYDEESGVYALDFVCDMDIAAPTIIYLNEKEHYRQGYLASVDYSTYNSNISKREDMTQTNFYKFMLTNNDRNAQFNTVMTSVILSKDMNGESGLIQSDYMKMMYEISKDSKNDGQVTFKINNFHHLGQKKHLTVEIYGRRGKLYCTIEGEKA